MSQGMPHWIKCWCSLQGMYLKAWKQPEDQFVSEPLLVIDINEVTYWFTELKYNHCYFLKCHTKFGTRKESKSA